jgi:hypothetical protein
MSSEGVIDDPNEPGVGVPTEERQLAEVLVRSDEDAALSRGPREHRIVARVRRIASDANDVVSVGDQRPSHARPDRGVEEEYTPFLITGPQAWNALGLGSTALHADTLVYNTKRSGIFRLGGRSFRLRRVAFPEKPPREWFVVDLLNHADQAGVSRRDVSRRVARAVAEGRLDVDRLQAMAQGYGRKSVRRLLDASRAASIP